MSRVFDEAQRRDPGIAHLGRPRPGVPVEGGGCFYDEGDPAAERWVRDEAQEVLTGQAGRVAAALRRRAARDHLHSAGRASIDECATYLTRKQPFLDYPAALERGWPIATGIIEGACRHLGKDRMDITGARWGLDGAEAVLKLRAIVSNGDFAEYWRYHLAQEHERVHRSRYADAWPTHLALAA